MIGHIINNGFVYLVCAIGAALFAAQWNYKTGATMTTASFFAMAGTGLTITAGLTMLFESARPTAIVALALAGAVVAGISLAIVIAKQRRRKSEDNRRIRQAFRRLMTTDINIGGFGG